MKPAARTIHTIPVAQAHAAAHTRRDCHRADRQPEPHSVKGLNADAKACSFTDAGSTSNAERRHCRLNFGRRS